MLKFAKCVVVLLIPLLSVGCQLPGPRATEAGGQLGELERQAPNPKPRPKQQPIYPSAEQLVQWHAQQCGGFTSATELQEYVAAPRLKQFFARLCLRGQSNPDELLSELEVISGQYYWPESSARYFWLLKQQLQANTQQQQQLAKLRQEQQQMQEKMQKTLSSLAAIEQQLLQRASQQEDNNEF
ncbi:hypothetical protein [Pseudoalteromonas sp. T1lg48]|uniref:hypothetical protein n=1 Tax=Pseudoalteromonas sp. T1lg48 TaxID=2077100 RepID=UPI000CF62BCD|nr:hypothetical protein [Pseudoalteromonas sp. T1lg48]